MSAVSVPAAPLQTLSVARSNGKVRDAAQQFEASFLASMLKPMFEGLSTDGTFGGGEGEAQFRSFMVDAMAKQMTRAGGIGLASTVQAEMLKLQEAR